MREKGAKRAQYQSYQYPPTPLQARLDTAMPGNLSAHSFSHEQESLLRRPNGNQTAKQLHKAFPPECNMKNRNPDHQPRPRHLSLFPVLAHWKVHLNLAPPTASIRPGRASGRQLNQLMITVSPEVSPALSTCFPDPSCCVPVSHRSTFRLLPAPTCYADCQMCTQAHRNVNRAKARTK